MQPAPLPNLTLSEPGQSVVIACPTCMVVMTLGRDGLPYGYHIRYADQPVAPVPELIPMDTRPPERTS